MNLFRHILILGFILYLLCFFLNAIDRSFSALIPLLALILSLASIIAILIRYVSIRKTLMIKLHMCKRDIHDIRSNTIEIKSHITYLEGVVFDQKSEIDRLILGLSILEDQNNDDVEDKNQTRYMSSVLYAL